MQFELKPTEYALTSCLQLFKPCGKAVASISCHRLMFLAQPLLYLCVTKKSRKTINKNFQLWQLQNGY
jgi:hypothetical protein